eukprot:EG_transcript_30925
MLGIKLGPTQQPRKWKKLKRISFWLNLEIRRETDQLGPHKFVYFSMSIPDARLECVALNSPLCRQPVVAVAGSRPGCGPALATSSGFSSSSSPSSSSNSG